MNTKEKSKGITLITLVITIIIILILAGITISKLTKSGLFDKAQQASKETKYAEARESLQLMLFEIKTRIIIEEKRDTQVTDCNELEGKKEITKIEYTDEQNIKYSLVTYKNYIFKVDKELNIVENIKDEISDEIIASGGKYIYNMGEVLEEAKSFIGLNDINSEYAINKNDLYMNIIEGTYNSVYIGTEQKVNLQNYTKIKCLVSTGSGLPKAGNCFYLMLNNTQVESIDKLSNTYISEQIGENETEYILEFDIPDQFFNKESYIGAVGTLKDIHIYKIWLEKSETKMLYDYGKVAQEAKSFIGVNDINSEYKINEESLYLTTKPGDYYNGAYIGTENKIDLTDYKKIRCLVSTGEATQGNSGDYFCLVIHNQQLPDIRDFFYRSSEKLGINNKEYYLSFKIPDECRNNNYYIGVNNCLQNAYVYKIWLEK